MAEAYVDKDRLQDEIGRLIDAAERLTGHMANVDRQLAERQDQLYSGEDRIYKEAIGPARRDISDASDNQDDWKAEVQRLEKRCFDLCKPVAGMPARTRGRMADRLDDARRLLAEARTRLTTIDDRITDMLDRVLYITERH